MNNILLRPYFNGLVRKKRLILDKILVQHKIVTVLDFGAGNGKSFSEYIADHYPHLHLTIFDTSKKSLDQITWASNARNVIVSDNWSAIKRKYDLIIASEVIEHQKDPVSVMISMRECLSDDGVLLITIPNGFGFTEITSFFKKYITQYRAKTANANDVFTLADSPHVSFFSNSSFHNVILDSSFNIIDKGNIVFSHFILMRYLSNMSSMILRVNFYICNFLPSWLCDDWFYILSKAPIHESKAYKPSLFSKFRTNLNLK
jgi:2-polyprenyl-3-methyl-5-hydroxy-6-metoxy-1,4-benzoquinol methylase